MTETTIAVDSVVFREDLYPRFKPSPERIQDYAENLDRLPPIEVNQRMELIDGYHRWTAHKKAGAAEVPAIITETKSDLEFERLSYQRNAMHGLQLAPEEKKAYAVRHYSGNGSAEEIAQTLSVSLRTVKRWVEKVDQAMREERDRKIREMWLACYTHEEIAESANVSRQTIDNEAGQLLMLDNWQKLAIFARYAEPDYAPPLYNFWNYSANSNKVKHFGNSDQRIVDNLLYMFTEPFDIVVDPFGGGGSTIDVCQQRLRRYWVSDRKPVPERNDIRQHDITQGTPPLHKRWSDVALMYLDPPYWRQAQGEYSSDGEDLANMPIEAFYETLRTFVSEAASKMRGGSHIALLIQPTQWRADDRAFPVDHVLDLVNVLSSDRLRYKMRIACPYQSEQYNAQQVEWAKANREVLVLSRELIVWRVAE